MKLLLTTTLLVSSHFSLAGEPPTTAINETPDSPHCGHCSSALAFAPAGIMGEHVHQSGDWMVGYHYMRMEMGGPREGTNDLTINEAMSRGYSAVAESMTMDMHMIEAMYAPTDWLTLMIMGNYIQNDMDMVMTGGMHGGSGMHSMSMGKMRHSHSTEGWGDTSLTALFPLYQNAHNTAVIGALGVSAPTGDVEVKNANGTFAHYDMQLGSGTWDLLPAVTATQRLGDFQLGAQLGAVIRLEDEGDSGYRKGHRYFVHGWVGYALTDWMSLNATLSASSEGEIKGGYDGPHKSAAPNDFPANYGGEIVDAGAGVNLLTPAAWGALFGNQRIGVRATTPIYQDLNGVGMSNAWSLFVSWQKSW